MALTAEQVKLLNNATPGMKKAKLGDILQAHEGRVAAFQAAAAGANPTKAEFDALVTKLINAGLMAPS